MTRLLRFVTGPVLACSLVLPASTPGLAAQVNKLNGPLAREIRTGHAWEYLASADGTRIVYRANKRAADVFELFSAPADGSGPSICLNDPLPPGGGVEPDYDYSENKSFLLASGGRVVYRADQTTDGVHELHVVPIDGSAGPVRITPAGFDVTGFWLTATDEVLFRSQGLDLFRVPLAGGVPVGIAFNRLVDRVWTSPDGATTVFSAMQPLSRRLFRVPTDGSLPPVQLDVSASPSSLGYESFFDEVRFAPDGVHVLYQEVMLDMDESEDGVLYTLRSATLDGSHPAVTLSQTEEWFRGGYAFDPHSASGRVAFIEDGVVTSIAFDGTGLLSLAPSGPDEWLPPLVHGTDVFFRKDLGGESIWRAAIDGSQPATSLFPGTFVTVRGFDLVGSTTIAFVGWDSTPFGGVYSVPVDGGTPLLLNPPALPQQGASLLRAVPGGQEILYEAAPGSNAPVELYVVPADAGAPPVLVSSPLVSGGVRSFTVAPGERVVYSAREVNDSQAYGLFGAPVSGAGPVVRYNDAIVSDTVVGDVTGFRSTADGTIVVYRADQEADQSYDLYAAHPSGLGAPVRLTDGLAAPLVPPNFELTPSGERVIFQTSAGGTFTLWSAQTTAAGTPVQLDAAASALDFRSSPDGARVVYRRQLGTTGYRELRSVPLDGATAPVTLHPPLAAGHGVQDFEIAADGARVVFRSGFELFSVPLDGSAPPVRLHVPLASTRAVSAFRIGPDGRRVVFLGDLALDDVVQLYSVPIAGGAAPRKLSGPLVAGGDVTGFVLAPDGRTVVYRADQVADQRFDLFSVPIEGRVRRLGSPPGGATLLTALSGTQRVELDFAVTSDGTQVVYRSNQDAAADIELFRVPTDASAAPVQLSAPLVAGGDVRSFAIAPDGSRVVYRADQRIVDVLELSSVPLCGGPAVVLDLMPDFADVNEYRIDPESRRVIYRADRVANGREELFAVPLDGSAPPLRVNRPLPPGGAVQDDFVVAPGGRTFHRADPLQADVLELYVDLDLADALLPATRAREH